MFAPQVRARIREQPYLGQPKIFGEVPPGQNSSSPRDPSCKALSRAAKNRSQLSGQISLIRSSVASAKAQRSPYVSIVVTRTHALRAEIASQHLTRKAVSNHRKSTLSTVAVNPVLTRRSLTSSASKPDPVS